MIAETRNEVAQGLLPELDGLLVLLEEVGGLGQVDVHVHGIAVFLGAVFIVIGFQLLHLDLEVLLADQGGPGVDLLLVDGQRHGQAERHDHDDQTGGFLHFGVPPLWIGLKPTL